MHIEIICTGDEVLTGKIVNTNFTYMSQKLEDHGLAVKWETTVGDDREDLLDAFLRAGARADAVIVNGGLGPTVDDLSQEVAAQAAGVELVLNEAWLERMRSFFTRRGRTMSENNIKQAMLPEGAELVDNPVGTACGFGVTIGKARFFFTPGVPRELRRMLEHELLPRLQDMSGVQTVIRLKRFHSYGLGESHVDNLLKGVEDLAPDGSVKLGFRAHYPQLETKLTVRGSDDADVRAKLAPVEAEIHRRIGNYILAEDNDTLEGIILKALTECQGSLAVVETFTGGQIAARVSPLPGAEQVFRRGTVARHLDEITSALDIAEARSDDSGDSNGSGESEPPTVEFAGQVARAARVQAGATHALAVIVALEDGEDRIDLGGTVCIAVATADDVASRRSRLAGGRDWIRLGATEMGLDSLRRYLQGLPMREPNDFEQVDQK